MSVESSAPRSRRAVLAAALGGLGAVVISRFATPDAAKAADGDPILAGNTTLSTADTLLSTAGAFTGLHTQSPTGTGLLGVSLHGDPTTNPAPAANTGVIGISGDTTNIAPNTGRTGIYGFSNTEVDANGIWGDSIIGAGVFGTGDTGVYGSGYWGVYGTGQIGVMGDATSGATGVYGFAGDTIPPDPAPGVGVQAVAGSDFQTALKVTGKVKFSRSGRVAVAAGATSKKVTMGGVNASTYIIATLQTRRTGVYVHAVVPGSNYFTIYLNKAVSSSTYVGYLVIN